MRLATLSLEGYRSYEKKRIEFGEAVTVVVGPNAIGKTNVLEGLRLISVGESFRAGRIEEMVRFGEEMGRVEAVIEDEGEETKLSVILTRGEMGGKRVAKRRYLINDVGKKKEDFVGMLPTVVFRPEDLELMDGSPSLRRKWFDGVLVQERGEYRRSLMAYEKALRRRNRVLEAVREGEVSKYQLTFWDGLVIKHGQVITEMRERLVGYINDVFSRSDLFDGLRIEYDKSLINERRIKQYEREEIMAGHTLVGPHKDDFVVISVDGGERDLSVYGSRGEQRMAVLGLKMGELLYLEEALKKKVVLLLDDVFSELDEEHAVEVHRVMLERQVVVTTTNEDDLSGLENVKVIKLEE
jgi:DNA replication and repair protein RecF